MFSTPKLKICVLVLFVAYASSHARVLSGTHAIRETTSEIDITGHYSTTPNGNPEVVVSSSRGEITFQSLNSDRPMASGKFDPAALSGYIGDIEDGKTTSHFTFDSATGEISWIDGSENDNLYRVSSAAGPPTSASTVPIMSGYYSESANGQPNAVITSDTTNKVISVRFLNSNRPIAQGKYDPQTLSGSVNFVDDRVYQFTFNPITGVITWDSPSNIWYRVSNTVSMSGYYSGSANGQPGAVIISDTTNKVISVHFLNSNRPIAQGKYDPQTLSGSVNFVDDRVYQFTFDPITGVITWDSPSNIWYRVSNTVSMSGYYSESAANGQPNAVITSDATNKVISVRFLNSNRPIAQGKYDPLTLSGSVNFVDDRVYQFTFNPITGVITWDSPGRFWYSVSNTRVLMSGYYSESAANGQPNAVITSDATNKVISVRFLNSNRPIAQGEYDPLTLSGSVNFVDDRIYQFTFNPITGVITWDSPGRFWYRVSNTVSMSGYYSESAANGQPNAVITSDATNKVISVRFLNSNRPIAQGKYDPLTLSGSVNFVDDRVYQFTFNPITGVITWDSPGRFWYRVSNKRIHKHKSVRSMMDTTKE